MLNKRPPRKVVKMVYYNAHVVDWLIELKQISYRSKEIERRAYAQKYREQNRGAAIAYAKKYRAQNGKAMRDGQRQHYKNNKLAYLAKARKQVYGITQEQWDALFASQGNRCAGCGSTSPIVNQHWHTDHDHTTGKVRGILCAHCNRAVHKHATPTMLRRLADYLERN